MLVPLLTSTRLPCHIVYPEATVQKLARSSRPNKPGTLSKRSSSHSFFSFSCCCFSFTSSRSHSCLSFSHRYCFSPGSFFLRSHLSTCRISFFTSSISFFTSSIHRQFHILHRQFHFVYQQPCSVEESTCITS